MIAVISLIVVAAMFVTAARVATITLVGTGMSTESAAFQVRSELVGVGFTTAEAEAAINHPVRRRVILWLMTFGIAGIITGVTSMPLGFINAEAYLAIRRSVILFGGLAILVLLIRSSALERVLGRFTAWALTEWTALDTRDFARLLHFSHNYGISELAAKEGEWLASCPPARPRWRYRDRLRAPRPSPGGRRTGSAGRRDQRNR